MERTGTYFFMHSPPGERRDGTEGPRDAILYISMPGGSEKDRVNRAVLRGERSNYGSAWKDFEKENPDDVKVVIAAEEAWEAAEEKRASEFVARGADMETSSQETGGQLKPGEQWSDLSRAPTPSTSQPRPASAQAPSSVPGPLGRAGPPAATLPPEKTPGEPGVLIGGEQASDLTRPPSPSPVASEAPGPRPVGIPVSTVPPVKPKG